MKNIKDYTNYTHEDFQAMSNSEFEAYAKLEHSSYLDDITSSEDYIEYGEYFRELEAIYGRRDKKYTFN